MADHSHLSIGEVLSLLQDEFPDVTISKIRFLESQGLVDPERTPSGYRKFYDQDIERLRWVLRQQRDAFLPLKVIKGRLDDPEAPAAGGRRRSAAGTGPRAGTALEAPQLFDAAPPYSAYGSAGLLSVGSVGEVVTEPGRRPAPPVPVPPRASRETGPELPDESEGEDGAGSPSSQANSGRSPAGGEPGPGEAAPASGPGPAAAPGRGARSRTRPGPAGTDEQTSGEPTTTGGPRPQGDSEPPPGPPGPPRPPQPHDPPAPPGAAVPPGPPARAVGGRSAPAAARAGRAGHRTAVGEPPGQPGAGGRWPSGRGGAVNGGAGAFDEELSLEELVRLAQVDPATVKDLERFGLVTPRVVGGTPYYDPSAATIARLAAAFARHGLEARHLRAYKGAAEREAGLVQQVVMPLLRQRNPEARLAAAEAAEELARLGGELRSALLAAALADFH